MRQYADMRATIRLGQFDIETAAAPALPKAQQHLTPTVPRIGRHRARPAARSVSREHELQAFDRLMILPPASCNTWSGTICSWRHCLLRRCHSCSPTAEALSRPFFFFFFLFSTTSGHPQTLGSLLGQREGEEADHRTGPGGPTPPQPSHTTLFHNHPHQPQLYIPAPTD